MTAFDTLEPRPADALLGLMAAFKADPREDKIDLGVGIYRDDNGATPIMAAVKAAEERLAQAGGTKAYEGPRGNLDYCAAIEAFVYADAARPGGLISFATPGGCGGLYLGMSLIKRSAPTAKMWVSDPTWPNHLAVAATLGLPTASYPYADPAAPAVDVDKMMSALSAAEPGDGVLIQGPCHNPTGIDLTLDEWAAFGKFCADRQLLPLLDVAYHGFAQSLDEDLKGVRTFLAGVPEAILAYSCSKNFGLYRDRSGAVLVQSSSEAASEAVRTHLADIARTSYSMPPAHGPAIVATILGDAALTAIWREELEAMNARMAELRASLADALSPRSNRYDPQSLKAQNGMFSQLPFVPGGTDALKEKGVYIPGSGRINIAGLRRDDIARVGSILSEFV